jgi:hypothetical protein
MNGIAMHSNSIKTWIDKIINRELSCSAVWITCGVGAAALVLPRIFPLSVNFLYYDDFHVLPLSFLRTHRFVPAAEWAFWFWSYGPEYPRSYIPKLVSFAYIMVGVWAMVDIFRAWNVPFLTALLAVLLFLVNPILTDYLVWNAVSSENLGWVFVLLGYRAQLETGRYALAAGIALGFLALGSYQLVVGLPAMLVLIEATLLVAREDKNSMPWKRRLAWVVFPIVLYCGYLLVSQWILGYSVAANDAAGTRGFPSPLKMFSLPFLLQQYHASSHGYFNVFQPLLSYFFGIEAAWRGAWKAWVFIALSVPTSLLLARASSRVLVSCSAMLLTALLMPMAFHWVVNVSSSGWRAAIGMLLAFSLWFVVLSIILVQGELWRIVVLANLGALALILSLVPVTVRDAKNRAQGSEATKSLIEFLETRQTFLPAVATAILDGVEPHPLRQQKPSRAIVRSFQEVSCKDYSVAGYQGILGSVLRTGGVNLVIERSLSGDVRHRLTKLCMLSRAQQRCGIFGVWDSVTSVGAACFYQ